MRGEAGFTLIEMLVALGITSMIAVAGSTLLVGSLRASSRLQATTGEVTSVDLAHTLIREDLANAVSIAGRLGRPEEGSRPFLAFIRDGWNHPAADDLRSSLLAIEYSYSDGALTRRAWLRPDPVSTTPYVDRVLATGVTRLSARYYDGRDWLPEWSGEADEMPRAVELRLEYTGSDALTELFVMGGGG